MPASGSSMNDIIQYKGYGGMCGGLLSISVTLRSSADSNVDFNPLVAPVVRHDDNNSSTGTELVIG